MEADSFSLDAFERVMQINLTATFVPCRDICKYRLYNDMRGNIINTTSLYTFIGSVRMVGYSMSQGGIGQLSEQLSNEWAGRGINFNAIAPGKV
jgi:2-deoxy-D-gluconate 3-dehydrogenase